MQAFIEIVGFALLLPGVLVAALGVLVMFGLGLGGEVVSGFLGGAAVCIIGLMLCGSGAMLLALGELCGLVQGLRADLVAERRGARVEPDLMAPESGAAGVNLNLSSVLIPEDLAGLRAGDSPPPPKRRRGPLD